MRRGCAIRKPVRSLAAPGAQVGGDVSAFAAASARATKGCAHIQAITKRGRGDARSVPVFAGYRRCAVDHRGVISSGVDRGPETRPGRCEHHEWANGVR
jgi:hypothetical protein